VVFSARGSAWSCQARSRPARRRLGEAPHVRRREPHGHPQSGAWGGHGGALVAASLGLRATRVPGGRQPRAAAPGGRPQAPLEESRGSCNELNHPGLGGSRLAISPRATTRGASRPVQAGSTRGSHRFRGHQPVDVVFGQGDPPPGRAGHDRAFVVALHQLGEDPVEHRIVDDHGRQDLAAQRDPLKRRHGDVISGGAGRLGWPPPGTGRMAWPSTMRVPVRAGARRVPRGRRARRRSRVR
jgi:hypothetical protein